MPENPENDEKIARYSHHKAIFDSFNRALSRVSQAGKGASLPWSVKGRSDVFAELDEWSVAGRGGRQERVKKERMISRTRQYVDSAVDKVKLILSWCAGS